MYFDDDEMWELMEMMDGGDFDGAMDGLGQTDCPEGCFVEPDGTCSHGFESLGLRMGLI